MYSNGLFSLGMVGPIGLLCLGMPAFELMLWGIVLVVRVQMGSKLRPEKRNVNLEWAIRTLVVSSLFPVLGFICEYNGYYLYFLILSEMGIFLLWPISAVLTILGKGVGRRLLLGGHGIIALFVLALFLSVRSHGLTFPHFP
jgi:hypothetical protein